MNKIFLVLPVWFLLGCGGAVAPDAGDAGGAFRCLSSESAGASLPCDDVAPDGKVIACDCPASCTVQVGAAVQQGTCVAPPGN